MKTREELLADVWQPDEDVNIGKFVIPDSKLGKILSAPTKAQTECPYCHGGREAKPVIETSSDFLAFDKNGTLAFGNDGSVEIFAGFTSFRYCPICGRKLGDE